MVRIIPLFLRETAIHFMLFQSIHLVFVFPSMLLINDISKGFTDSQGTVPLFQRLSLVVQTGKSASIMGPSGCGKSTLLHTIASLLPIDQGTITLHTNGAELDIGKMDEKAADNYRKMSVGIVFQRYNLIEYLSADENIRLPAKHKNNIDVKYIHSICEQLQIKGLLHKSPAQLSGGEQQRVAIARALAHKPQLVLADEPTGNLDPKTSDTVSRLLFELCEETETTLIVVTHSVTVADMAHNSYALENLNLVHRNTP